MTVVVQHNIEGRRYNGWLDPRYPIGFWQAAISATGDATGGALVIDLLFQQANGPERLNSQLYSVERFGIRIGNTTDRIVRILANNMGGPANQGFLNEYAVACDGVDFGGTSILRAESLDFLPWFLGSQRTAGITASLSIAIINADTLVLDFEAEGYLWSPRSVLVDGGPQRPPTGLYRA